MEVETIELQSFWRRHASARVLALLTKNLVFPRKGDFGAITQQNSKQQTFHLLCAALSQPIVCYGVIATTTVA